MDKTCYIFVSIFLATCLMSCLAKTSLNLTTDQHAILHLKSHFTSDPFHILTKNWTNSSSVCWWNGVACNARHRRVIALNISNMGLQGTISPRLGNLSFLATLDLGYNNFSGTLPQELSLLRRLKFFSVISNKFVGEIPSSLGRLHDLQELVLEGNHLSGDIPSAIFNISSLKIIALTSNELSGTLPNDICRNLPFLERLFLGVNKLSGQIPSNLSRCSHLQFLSLSYNMFDGGIPPEIGKLTNLQYLALGGNNLNGIIPQEIGNLQNLVQLWLEKNKIIGEVPSTIFNISSLQTLFLRENELVGKLPTDIWNLTALRILDLERNHFTGVLPREICHLKVLRLGFNSFTGALPREIGNLEALELNNNSFSGIIPVELFNSSTLNTLLLALNDLSGTLPTNMCYASHLLEELIIGGNQLTGIIPDSLSNCSSLKYISLGLNKFTGLETSHIFGNLPFLEYLQLFGNNLRIDSSSLITSLTNCRSLDRLDIADNPLYGIIPASVGNLSSSLRYFYAYNCTIKGDIPPDIGNLSNLLILSLFGNELSGNIPPTIKYLHKLQGLDLHNNSFSGTIPEGLCDLNSLSEVILSQNQLSGPIPECLGNVASLRFLLLDSNNLSSYIPPSLLGLRDLLKLDLSSNYLSGPLPPEIGNLVAAIHIDLSMNQLSESIPSTIGNLLNLINLSLAHNNLQGSVLTSIGSMMSLVSLDLSNNSLSASIPRTLESLQYLKYLNVSFNVLSGEIPNGGPFKNFTMESFRNNVALCGAPRFNVPSCHTISSHRSKMKKVKFAMFIVSGVVVLLSIVSLAIFFKRYKRKHDKEGTIDVLASIVRERISYNDILEATERFHERNLVGHGSFGSVYRGLLTDGKTIAVKVFRLESESAFKSFDTEREILHNIRHRNLIKIMSSCSNKNFKALVLEYMPKGNLEKWLYSHNYCLDVMQRLNIMIDVASALEYLHHGYSTPIVHCDLKPSNVLLDEEMVAHVSDFGIGKLFDKEESNVFTSTLATLGYIAPEYGSEGLVSTKCDVYSNGIVLMETFTIKRPSDDMFGGDLSLRSWVERSFQQSIHQVVDVNLLKSEANEFNKTLQCVSSVLKLALNCAAESPGDRINMKQVVAELHKIKHQFSH